MINLLPDDTKKDLSAARQNVLLLRYSLLTVSMAVILLLICATFYVYLKSSQATAMNQNQENVAKAESYKQTEIAAEEYKQNLATAKSIFEKSVDYTPTIIEIVKLLPSGVILESISLSTTDFSKETIFTAKATSIKTATQLKQNFQGSDMFSDVKFQNVNTSNTGTDYPVVVTLSVQINKVPKQ